MVGLNVDSSSNVGVEDNTVADVMGKSGLDLVVGNVPSGKDVGGNKEELVWGGSAVDCQVDNLGSFLEKLEINEELGEEFVVVLSVNKHLESVLSDIESTIGIVFVQESPDHGFGVEGKVSDKVHLELLGGVDGGPLGLVAPHALSILLALNVSRLARNNLDSQFNGFSRSLVLQVELSIFELHLDLSLNSSSEKRVFGHCLEVELGDVLLDLGVDLDNLLVSSLELNLDSVSLGVGLTLDGSLKWETSGGSADTNLKVSVNILEIKVLSAEGEILNSGSISVNDNVGGLSWNSVGDNLEISTSGGVQISEFESGLSVGGHGEVEVGDSGGDDGCSCVTSSGLGLDSGDPPGSLPCPADGGSSGLITISISVGQLVVEAEGE